MRYHTSTCILQVFRNFPPEQCSSPGIIHTLDSSIEKYGSMYVYMQVWTSKCMYVCLYVCMYVYEYLSRYFLFLVIIVFRNRRESFRRFESDEYRIEVMSQYTEVDSLYVYMYMIALNCMYCICAYLRVQINLKVSL